VRSLVFSPDGETLISGGKDKTVRLWGMNSGNLRRTFVAPDQVYAVAISPDGQTLISGGEDRTVSVWQMP
jgi:WD40 repeat protein